jgi:hypothetical protein
MATAAGPPPSSWFFLNEEEILAPLKVDISFKGARYVDSFCWNCNPETNTMSPYEFSCRTCADVGLPDGFQLKMAMQIQEQVDAYRILINMLKSHGTEIISRMNSLMPMTLGIRLHTVDYADHFQFDCCNSTPYAPEYFAKVTVMNLGLPGEMEPVIAHNIRENIFRMLFAYVEQQSSGKAAAAAGAAEASPELAPSQLNVTVVAPNQAVDMITNLWRRARPMHFDDQQSIPQPMMPAQVDANAHVWRTPAADAAP